MRPDSRDEVESKRRGGTNGSLTKRVNGKHAQFLKSDARLNRFDRAFVRFHMKDNEIDAEIREVLNADIRMLAERRRLPPAHLDRWLAMDDESSGELFALAQILRLRTGQLVSALEMLDEIAVREQIKVAAILNRDEIVRILSASGSGPARASGFLEVLRQIRFPRLRAMQERLRAEVSALKLPRGISVDLPKELGSDELTVSLRVRSADDLGRLIAALNQSRAGLARIVEMLGGEPAGIDSKDSKDEI